VSRDPSLSRHASPPFDHAGLDKLLQAIQPELRRIARLHVSVGTVRRDWSLARAWLYRELRDGGRRDISLDADTDV
jgi:hypothetical protein